MLWGRKPIALGFNKLDALIPGLRMLSAFRIELIRGQGHAGALSSLSQSVSGLCWLPAKLPRDLHSGVLLGQVFLQKVLILPHSAHHSWVLSLQCLVGCLHRKSMNYGAGEDPWTSRRSNQSILREINPEYSLEGLMLKLKLQYFGHLMQRADSLEKTLMLGKMKAGGEGWQSVRCLHGITALSGHESDKLWESEGQGSLAYCSSWHDNELDTSDWKIGRVMRSASENSWIW